MDLVSGAKGACRAPSGALPCSGSELNSAEQAVCLKITQPATQWHSACRVQPPEPLQTGKKKERVNCRYLCVEGGGGVSIQKHNTKQP